MNIREALEAEHSKAQAMRIVAYIGDDTARLDELMLLFFDNNYRISQRAAWSVSWLADSKPTLILPYLERMILNVKNEKLHPAIRRNTMRVLRELPEIPNNLLGLAADASFHFLENPSEAVAVRAFSMRVLHKICQKEPELRDELRLLLEDILQHETMPALISTARDILKSQ